MPAAARVTDLHLCPLADPKPHVGGPIIPVGCPTVIIGYMPAARKGDKATCVGPLDTISAGSSNVLIGNKDAARKGDPTQHGGKITTGCGSVLIGDSGQALAIKAAAAVGAPFCES